MFAINPLATGGASNNPIVYGSLTTGVCTVSGTTVSIVSAGNCAISADQAGNANYAAAMTVAASVVINAIAPSAPIIGAASAGNAQASIAFTPPLSNGGSAIANYTATCGGQSATSGASPITVTGLANGVTVSCSVTATNSAMLTGPASATVMVTPQAIAFNNLVYSRKMHGGISRDIPINHLTPANGAVDIEPRAGNAAHTIYFDFTSAVSNSGSVVVTDVVTGMPISGPTSAPAGNSVAVTLTNVPEKARITITLSGVNGAVGASASMGLLVGDVNGSGKVTAADIAAIKSKNGSTVDGTSFKFDINVSGTTISSADVTAAKARAAQVLP